MSLSDAAEDVGRDRQPRVDSGIESCRVVELVRHVGRHRQRLGAAAAAAERVAHVDMRRERALPHRPDEGELDLRATGSEQLLGIAGRQADVDAGRHAAAGRVEEAELAAQQDVAEALRARALAERLRQGATLERVDSRAVGRGQPDHRCLGGRVHVDRHERHDQTHVEPVGHTVVEERREDAAGEVERQAILDDVAFEERVRAGRQAWSGCRSSPGAPGRRARRRCPGPALRGCRRWRAES